MIHIVFSIYDAKAQAYLPPFFMHSEAVAVRAFSDGINDKEHAFGRHPSDYTLFNIGNFDDATGKIEPATPIAVASGHTLVEQPTSQGNQVDIEEMTK